MTSKEKADEYRRVQPVAPDESPTPHVEPDGYKTAYPLIPLLLLPPFLLDVEVFDTAGCVADLLFWYT